MNPVEKRVSLVLALIMSCRMLGLFMILPVFSPYAHQLLNATPTLIGLAIGVYGLTQAIFQLPFGMLSDYLGRKKIIFIGLSIFGLGSVIAALSHSIEGIIIGRALQGAGAIGSTLMALLADLTRESERTKGMAIVGMSIGFSFFLAFTLGTILNTYINVNGIFWLTAGLSLLAMVMLVRFIPNYNQPQPVPTDLHNFKAILFDRDLFRLNLGIFSLHAILSTTFVALPLNLSQLIAPAHQWKIFLSVILIAFALAVPLTFRAERRGHLKTIFLFAIGLIGTAELIWSISANSLSALIAALFMFFMAFSSLESLLPSLISRAAPKSRKGTALGIYSCCQFLGIFVGGSLGGWLYGQFSLNAIYLFGCLLSILWIISSYRMTFPQSSSKYAHATNFT